MTKPMRLAMPTVAAFIDELRDAFGSETINPSIKSGIDGQPTFWASENGNQIGTRPPYDGERSIRLSDTLVGPMNAPQAHSANRKGK